MRFVAVPSETGWQSLCLDHDIASIGSTAQSAAKNCLEAVKEAQAVVRETPGMEMQPPPPAWAIRAFFLEAAIQNNTLNVFYLLDFTE